MYLNIWEIQVYYGYNHSGVVTDGFGYYRYRWLQDDWQVMITDYSSVYRWFECLQMVRVSADDLIGKIDDSIEKQWEKMSVIYVINKTIYDVAWK